MVYQTYATDWTKVTLPIPYAEDFAFLKINDDTCYAFVLAGAYYSYSPKVLISYDDGATWDSIAQQGLAMGNDVKKAVKSGQNLYVLSDVGIYKSTDNALTWTQVNQAEISGMYCATDILADDNKVYACSPSGLFITTDEFATIQNINGNLNIGGYNYQIMCIAKLNGVFFASTNSKVFYLVDTTWTQCTSLPDRATNYNIMAYANGHYYLSDRANNDYTLYHSLDGISWTVLDSNAAFSDYTINNNYLFATKVTYGDYKRYCVYSNSNTLTDITSDLPAFSTNNGVQVLGNNIFVGIKNATASSSGLYTRSFVPDTTHNNINNLTYPMFSLFPNPVTDYLYIQKGNTSSAIYSIFDVSGKCIIEGTINEISSRIDVNSFRKGMYFLKIKNSSYPFIKE